jgi:hypothetical protein
LHNPWDGQTVPWQVTGNDRDGGDDVSSVMVAHGTCYVSE